MPQLVAVPGVGDVEFPDEATPEMMEAALREAYPQSVAAPPPVKSPKRQAMDAEMARLLGLKDAGYATGFATELKENAGEMARGVVQFIPATLKALGRTAEFLNRNVIDLGTTAPGEDVALTQLGKAAEEVVDENLPQAINPDDLAGQVNRGIGQAVGALATGGGAKAVGFGAKGAAAIASIQGAGTEFDDAFDRATRRGDSPDLAFAKSLGYATVATLIENKLGMGRLMKKFYPTAGQAAQALTAKGVSKEIIKNVVANYAEEAGQRIAQNVIVAPEEGIFTGAHDEGKVGAIVGGIVGLPGAGYRPRGRTDETTDQAPGIPVQNAPRDAVTTVTIAPGTEMVAQFRGRNGQAIEVALGTATLEQVQELISRTQPGAEFLGTAQRPVPTGSPAAPAEAAQPAAAGSQPAQPGPGTPAAATELTDADVGLLPADEQVDAQAELDAMQEEEEAPTPDTPAPAAPQAEQASTPTPVVEPTAPALELTDAQVGITPNPPGKEPGDIVTTPKGRSAQIKSDVDASGKVDVDIGGKIVSLPVESMTPAPKAPEAPRASWETDPGIAFSTELRGRTIKAALPFLSDAQPDDTNLATLRKVAEREFGKLVGELVAAGPLHEKQQKYINQWTADYFARAVYHYAQLKGLLKAATATVDKPAPEAQPTTEATNERADTNRGTGQPVESPPLVDDGQPAGPPVATPPAEPAGGAPGPEAPAGTGPGGPAQAGPRPERRRGVRGGNGGNPGAQRRPGDVGQSPDAPANREAAPRAESPEPVAAPAPEPVAPPPNPADRNHVLTADADWLPAGAKAKVRANLDAIRLLKQLEAENRNPTPEEKAVLAQYTGWGGLKQVFDEGKARYRERAPWNEEQRKEYENWEKQWGKLYDQVKAELGDAWDAAASSILNAHYTSRTVINGVWAGVQRMGFKGGNALEPAGGIGHFIGLQPEASREATRWHAVEIDPTSARILAKLYPQARVQQTGFETARLPANSFDLVISNVPFAKDGPIDKRYPRFSLHNYFFARALDLVKPGGIIAFITSDSTMDGDASRQAREFLAERADLVGAIRLPNNAFKENAGTEVTTDVLYFRKRDGTPFEGQAFVRPAMGKTYKGKPLEFNEYFVAHPEMMLGRMSDEGTMYREGQRALLPVPGADLATQLTEAVAKLPADVMGQQATPESVAAPEAVQGKIGGLTFANGKPVIVNADGTTELAPWASSANAVKQAQSYVAVRDAAKETIGLMLSADSTEDQIKAAQAKLNALYDAYHKKHGPLNARGSAFLDDDIDFPLALALEDGETVAVETKDKKGKPVTRRATLWKKAKMFTERTLQPRVAPSRVDTIDDGLQVSMNYRGRVDLEYIALLTGKPVEDVQRHLAETGQAFENPESGQWEPAWKYLSGFVKKKLAAVRARVEDNPLYPLNVAALEKVIPAPIAFENIGFRLGSTFVPPSAVEGFMREKLGVEAKVSFTPETGNWIVTPEAGWQNEDNRTRWGIHGISGHQMVSMALNLKSPTVTTTERRVSDSTGKAYDAEVKEPKATLEAQEKQHQVKQAFIEWVKGNPTAASDIEAIYNEEMNGTALPKFEAPTWSHYPGAASDIKLRPHQMRVVTRGLQNSFGLFHAVGTGKTYIGITWAMELRRLGLAKKPMIVVQNATLEQFARSFKRLYPTARILAPSANQRNAKNRNRTMSRIATGDWDAVIVPQSFINMLPDDPVRERQYIADQVAELKAALLDAAHKEGERSVKAADLQRAINTKERQLREMASRRTDDVLTLEQLGTDALFVDEAHAYKKLQFTTSYDNIKGLDKGYSERGFSMLMKVRWVQEKNQGRNVIFATGTPVSNTMAEAWTMMRYLRPDVLEEFGMKDFDAFAGNFADSITQLEMTATGDWKPETRFARFTNGPELIAAWRTVADVVTAEEINLPGLPSLKNGKVTAVSIPQTESMAGIIRQLRARIEAFHRMTGRQKKENSHIPMVAFTDAKKASVDPRCFDASLPDEPGSKLNVAVEQVERIWRESANVKGTQMVFADGFRDSTKVFNAHEELKRKLIARGIPESEIVVVTDKHKDAARETLFNKFNAGEVRVLIGTSARMGVGVNAQEHLIGLHHLDAPARPMDVEQRNGRILRQRNQNLEVEILSYGVENSLDSAMFQKLATKQRFINQILMGEVKGRNFEDAANEISLSFEEQMAAYSGDPLTLEKVTLENQLRTLETLRAGHFNQVRQARENLADIISRRLPYQRNQLAAQQSLAADYAQRFADLENAVLEFGGRKFTGRKNVVAFLDEFLKGKMEDAVKAADTTKNYHRFYAPTSALRINGVAMNVGAESATGGDKNKDGHYNIREVEAVWSLANGANRAITTGQGFFTSLRAELERVANAPEGTQGTIDSLERDRRQLAGFVEQPFDREAEMADAQARYAILLAKMTSSTAQAKQQQAPQSVAPLGFEVSRWKPLEGERAQIIRLLEQMGRRQEEFEEWHVPSADLPPGILSGHPAWMTQLEVRLKEIERQMIDQARQRIEANLAQTKPKGINIKLGDNSQAGFALNPVQLAADLVTFGKEVVRRLGGWGVSFARWSAAMVRQFGNAVRVHLAATWASLARLARAATAGLSPAALGHANAVEELAGNTNIPLEQHPLYGPDVLAAGAPSLATRLSPKSTQIRVLGGQELLDAKRRGDIEEATAAAAVKQQSDNLWRQLQQSAAAAHPLARWHLPQWLIGTPRARRFKERALHIAARLNVTGYDAAGNFTFGDFVMRAGRLSLRAATRAGLSPGDTLSIHNPVTGVRETLTVGPLITTPQGAPFLQLERPMDAATQAELYRHYAAEFPEMMWFLNMFIDPALANTRETHNGVEIPIFNRFAAAAMMADGNPTFTPLTAYTPDVLVTRSLMASIQGALSFRAGTRSPGRKYKTGTSRESGHVRDLLSGFNIRTWQMLAEQSRRQWARAVLDAATPIRGNTIPAGFVKLETGMDNLWQAVKRLRRWTSPVDPATGNPHFPETEQRLTDDGSPEYRAFFGEAASLRGRQLMLPEALVTQLVRKYQAHVEHGRLYRLGAWLVRNSTRLFLVAPTTVVANILTNDLFTVEAATRRLISGVVGGNAQDLRFARELAIGEAFKFFPGLRTLIDRRFRNTVAEVLPDNIFGDQTALADVKVRMDVDPLSYLRSGEIGAAALQFIRYGNIDVRSKQRMAYAWLKAQAVTNARTAGLRGSALRAAVDRYMVNPPMQDRARAVDIAGFELLNYVDSPDWLETFAGNDFSKLLLPFPRFGYHYIAKNAQRAAAVRTLLSRVPARQRADAFADFITFLMYPAGGLGILAAYAIKGLGGEDDDDDARKLVGTSFVKGVDKEGDLVAKPIDRALITSNRINLSAWARGLGLGTESEDDFWMRVRNYPVIAMAGAAVLAENDARKYGAKEGAKSYLNMVGNLAADFFSVGMAAKVPAKAQAELFGRPGDRSPVDPYATGVPFVAYVVDQTLDSFVPGTRQADIVIRWVDPTARRRTASKTLDFAPTAWDSARVGHWSGLLDRLLAGKDGTTESTLPPEGPVNRRSGAVTPQVYPVEQRIAELLGFNIRPINREAYEEAIRGQ